MPENAKRTAEELLASTNPEEIRLGLRLARERIAGIPSGEALPLFEMVSAFFYIDPLDRPDLVPVIDEAITLVGSLGKWVVPVLVEHLNAGDLKAQMAAAQALGRMGEPAIDPLMAAYESSPDSSRRAFVLYALGMVKSPEIVRAARLAIEAARSPDLELRDTATRAIGKFVESIPVPGLSEEMRHEFINALHQNLADPRHGIRAKAVRSLGKLAKHGHMSADERRTLKATCLLLSGKDESFEWDRAYVVRKEAEEVLQFLRQE
jgi:hypothetical protein